MTSLLKEAPLTKVETLSYEVQDAIAARLIADFEDELAWQDRFAATTDEQWDKLADMVRQEIADGDTMSLDDFFGIFKSIQLFQNFYLPIITGKYSSFPTDTSSVSLILPDQCHLPEVPIQSNRSHKDRNERTKAYLDRFPPTPPPPLSQNPRDDASR